MITAWYRLSSRGTTCGERGGSYSRRSTRRRSIFFVSQWVRGHEKGGNESSIDCLSGLIVMLGLFLPPICHSPLFRFPADRGQARVDGGEDEDPPQGAPPVGPVLNYHRYYYYYELLLYIVKITINHSITIIIIIISVSTIMFIII